MDNGSERGLITKTGDHGVVGPDADTGIRSAAETHANPNVAAERRDGGAAVGAIDREALLERLVAISPVITAVAHLERFPGCHPDPRPVARFVSPAVIDVLGYLPDEVIDDPWFLFRHIHPDDKADAARTWEEGVARGLERVRQVYRVRHADGAYRWMRSTATTVPDDLGLVYAHFLDITEHRLAEKQAERARDEAESASTAKTEFLSRMSHELRTPLNAVLGFAQLLEMGALDDEQILATQQIMRAGSHLLRLINEIVELSRIEAGVLDLSLEAVEITSIVADALDLLQPAANDRNVTLINDIDADSLVAVRADRQRLFQVLLNLLSNAVKYNGKGGRVVVESAVVPAADDADPDTGVRGDSVAAADLIDERVVRLSVADDGIGIPSDRLDEVFIAFDRLGAERLGIDGTGIGLTVSKALVEHMGGSIGLESCPGEGSTFWVELPFEAPPQPVASESDDDAHGAATAEPGKDLIVLYVEDNSSNLRLVGRVLERRQNVRMVPAMQGQLGLQLASQLLPDLVLMDLHLPDMDGIDVLRSLRREPVTKAIPVVVLSADATPANIDRLLEAGAQSYLTKPFQIDELLAIVDAVAAGNGVSSGAGGGR